MVNHANPTGSIPEVDMSNYELHGCLQDMFLAQAAKTPTSIAIVSEGKEVTFQELDEWTNILALKLRHLRVRPDSIVGIYLPKGIEFIVAYIGILKAGVAMA
ncbi:unnamed protein product, partial [Cyprideis torosa]